MILWRCKNKCIFSYCIGNRSVVNSTYCIRSARILWNNKDCEIIEKTSTVKVCTKIKLKKKEDEFCFCTYEVSWSSRSTLFLAYKAITPSQVPFTNHPYESVCKTLHLNSFDFFFLKKKRNWIFFFEFFCSFLYGKYVYFGWVESWKSLRII